MNYLQMTAPCGLDCFNCPMYLANEDQELKAGISEKMKIPIELASCKGCRNHGGIMAFLGMSGPCNVYQCIEKRGIKLCSECTDFPCDHLHPYADKASLVPHNTKVFNLCLIRKMGLEAWAKDKAKSVKHTYFSANWKL